MSNTETFLAHNPIIGFISTMVGFIAPFISDINPVLQFLTLCFGLVIGGLTIEAKHKERKKNEKHK